ncbi:MAG: VWA domain-containing protein [Corynebacterium sp.]|uniref:vWA domain-containing protein n=1 Tax=Corynebacterium sp. TaxID=1720 RepID=UPI0026DAB5FB|nr:VWA domain-containing protein [Corynebacterium sp.]MDO4760909.1 VWA domain-containing protein [Corynebacterium sp.]
MSTFSFRPAISLIAASVLMVGLSPIVSAQEQATLRPTVLVLDSSGSMLETDVDGRSRMDAAKQAVGEFIDHVPHGAPLGLITYGTGTGSSEEEKDAGCQDISVIARPGEKDKQALKDAVARFEPRGYTPIGNSLREAAELLPKEGARSVVLVSDGIDTCAPPPVCEVAQELKNQGTDLVVHTVGFKVDDAARAELECIAQVTGGTYADASSAESLKASLTTATTRTAVGYQLPSTRVEFSADKKQAPTLDVGTVDKPARYHVVAPTTEKEPAHFTVDVPENHTLHIGMRTVPPVGTKKFLEGHYGMTIFAESCSGETLAASDITADMPASGYFIAQDCTGEQSFNLHLTGSPVKDVDFTVVAVPKPTDLGDDFNKSPSTGRSAEDLSQPAPSENPQKVTPASQPDESAPLINGTVEAEIVEGETQFFAVPIEWGQALDVTAEVLEDTLTESDNFATSLQRSLDVNFSNAIHEKIASESSGPLFTKDIGKPVVIGTKFPIAYANASEAEYPGHSSWLGGTHYVQVSARSHGRDHNTDATTELKPIKYRLTASPVGQAVKGPTFPKASTQTPTVSSTTANAADSNQAAPEEKESSWLIPGFIIALVIAAFGAAGYSLQRKK